MNVTVFSSTGCAVCHAEMQWLNKEGVSYDNVVIDESDDGMEKLLEATGGAVQGTPVTVIKNGESNEVVNGFDRKRLIYLLDLA